jgi:hypothetical protein
MGDRVGAAVNLLRRGEGGGDEDHAFFLRLERVGLRGKELPGEGGLLRDKAEAALRIVLQEIVDDTIAEGADAVVQNQVAAFDLRAKLFHEIAGSGGWERSGRRCLLQLLYWSRCRAH